MPYSPQVIWNVATNTTVEATPPPSGPSLPSDWSFFSSAPSNPSLSLGRQDYESVWRYSSKAVYSVYNSDTDRLVRGKFDAWQKPRQNFHAEKKALLYNQSILQKSQTLAIAHFQNKTK